MGTTTGTGLSSGPFPEPGVRTLVQCEEAIHISQLMAGQAFKEIRDRRLYVPVYGVRNFEQYCQEKFQYTRRRVNQLIRAYELCEELRANVNMGTLVPNLSERHYRALAKLKTKRYRAAAIGEIQQPQFQQTARLGL